MNLCLMIRLCELFYIASYINWVCFLLFVYIYFANFFGWENIAFTFGEQNFYIIDHEQT